MGKSFNPVPFGLLTSDGGEDDYIVTVDRRVLEGGASRANHAPDFNQAYADRVARSYGPGTGGAA
jgi:hypothetical protein